MSPFRRFAYRTAIQHAEQIIEVVQHFKMLQAVNKFRTSPILRCCVTPDTLWSARSSPNTLPKSHLLLATLHVMGCQLRCVPQSHKTLLRGMLWARLSMRRGGRRLCCMRCLHGHRSGRRLCCMRCLHARRSGRRRCCMHCLHGRTQLLHAPGVRHGVRPYALPPPWSHLRCGASRCSLRAGSRVALLRTRRSSCRMCKTSNSCCPPDSLCS